MTSLIAGMVLKAKIKCLSKQLYHALKLNETEKLKQAGTVRFVRVSCKKMHQRFQLLFKKTALFITRIPFGRGRLRVHRCRLDIALENIITCMRLLADHCDIVTCCNTDHIDP